MGTKILHSRLDSHQRLLISLVFGIIAFFIISSLFEIQIAIVGAWNIFALTDIILAWFTIIKKDARETVQNAKLQDSSRSIILSFVTAAAIISLAAIALLLKTARHFSLHSTDLVLLLGFITIIVSWTFVHTVFAIHYAHIFYAVGEKTHRGGLEFPKEEKPAFADFAYYSFVVGMTFQVSDVQVTSRRMRKITLIHSIISFLFNTFILAIAINIIAGLL